MEKRSLFNLIFGKKKEEPTITTSLQLLNGWNTNFTPVQKIYSSKIARECIDRIATHASKMIPKHIQNNVGNVIYGDINYLLSQEPNPLMNTQQFIYKITSILYTYSNAFVYIDKDKQGNITAFYPVQAQSYKLLQSKDENSIYFKFQWLNGKSYYLNYFDLIHLRLFYNDHDIYGTDASEVLMNALDTAQTAEEGIKNAIKSTANLKGILQFEALNLKSKDIKDSRDEFVKDYLNLDNEGGIAALDGKAHYTPLNQSPVTLSSDQMKEVKQSIYDFFGVNQGIIENNFTENQWNAFFEGVIEPLSIQYGNAFTNKIFNKYSIKQKGNRIAFTTNRIHYASIDSKIKLIQVVAPLGALTKDEVREILDMQPLGGEEGSKLMQSLNNINSSIADDYQGGNSNGESN